MTNDLARKRRAERCSTHSHACDCREYAHAQEIERLRAEVDGLREQHGRDSAELRRLCAARDEQRDGRLSALERAVAAERERDALLARAERAEGRIADEPAVKAMCADLLTRLQRLSGENPVARVILLPEDWPEIEELIASVNKIAQHEKEPTEGSVRSCITSGSRAGIQQRSLIADQ